LDKEDLLRLSLEFPDSAMRGTGLGDLLLLGLMQNIKRVFRDRYYYDLEHRFSFGWI
jgi:hypothetical protein